jgi:ParB family chromosome partitioning protein
MEEAQGFQSLRDQFGLTQEQIGKAVGRSRTAVANTLRLLGLPPVVRELLEKGRLSMGHARALLAVTDVHRAETLAKMAALNGWSVREVERRVAAADGSSGRAQRSKVARPALDATLRALREEMREAMGTRVNLRPGKQGRGVVEIPYRDAQDFERVFSLITGREVRDVME